VPNQPAELLYGELAYVQPVDQQGTFISLGGALTRINEGDGSATDSTSYRITLRAWHPLIRAQSENLWLNGAFEYYNLDQEYDGARTAEDRLRVLRTGFNYWRADRLSGNTFVLGELSQGLPILGASSSNSLELTSFKGRSDFTKFTLAAAREQGLTDAVGLQVSASAQKSLNRLLSSEQFAYGGSQFGAAYDFAEISGDDGLAARIELRYGRAINRSWLDAYQLFVGYDLGLVWNDAAGRSTVRDSLASVGGGIRLTFPRGIRGALQVAKALPAVDSTAGDDGSRISFTLSAEF
jgi:hemolysin activation/secretion protein